MSYLHIIELLKRERYVIFKLIGQKHNKQIITYRQENVKLVF